MAFGRTANTDKEAERLERDQQKADARRERDQQAAAEKAAKQTAAAEKAFQESPVGRATTSLQEGAGFFHIQLEMSEIGRSGVDSFFGYSGGVGVERKRGGHTDVLSQIEDVGWRVEHVGYVYMETGQISRDKFLSSGQEVATLGKTVGHFLFRRAEPTAVMAPSS